MERPGRLAPCGSRRPNSVREALRLHQTTYLSAMRPGLSAAQETDRRRQRMRMTQAEVGYPFSGRIALADSSEHQNWKRPLSHRLSPC